MQKGFDNDKYIALQSEHIRKRIAAFGGKLYLEFGGKLFDDYHASRVLPGFEPDSKIRMLQSLSADCEIMITINAHDIEENKVRADLGITYDKDVIRLIGIFRSLGFYVGSVVISRYMGQPGVEAFCRRLSDLGVPTYRHYAIPGYPFDVAGIVSENGYGKNDYVETQRPLVVVTAPGPGSGKMATCLSQLYHENLRGIKAGYAKFETFPIWNLPLDHPVNLAYEAATVDLDDMNMIDPFHLSHYGITTVNYNRDVEIFPVLRAMMEKILGESPYHSPTDMGVNMAGFCITDDVAVCDASKMEILRRYYRTAAAELRRGSDGHETAKLELLMRRVGVTSEIYPAVAAAKKKAEESGTPSGAMVLADGTVVTGKTSLLLRSPAAVILNALKHLAGIPDNENILSPESLQPLCDLKLKHLHHHNPRLHTDEILLALTLSSKENPAAEAALARLPELRGCNAHFSVLMPEGDAKTYASLGICTTSEAKYDVKVKNVT